MGFFFWKGVNLQIKKIQVVYEIRKIKVEEKSLLISLMDRYFTEIAEYDFDQNASSSIREYPYLDSYWGETNRIPLFIYAEKKQIGFALINEFVLLKRYKKVRSIAEFYILPGYRRKGIGRKVAFDLFQKYGLNWEIRQQIGNEPAQKFWLSVINTYTEGDFEDVFYNNGTYHVRIQLFSNQSIA